SKKRVGDRIADLVQPHLNAIEKFVQTAVDDFTNLNVVQLRGQPSELLFGGIAEGARRRSGDGVQRSLGIDDAVMNRARKLAIENQKLDDAIRRYLLKSFSIHFKRARRSKNRCPHEIVIRRADGIDRRQQQVVLRIE